MALLPFGLGFDGEIRGISLFNEFVMAAISL
jgi:hypothetical protein